jgi:hypothetical protein
MPKPRQQRSFKPAPQRPLRRGAERTSATASPSCRPSRVPHGSTGRSATARVNPAWGPTIIVVTKVDPRKLEAARSRALPLDD